MKAQRGFIREGYFADLVLVDTISSTLVTHQNSLYKCGWTPFSGHEFSAKVLSTWVNGQQVFNGMQVLESPSAAMPLMFHQ